MTARALIHRMVVDDLDDDELDLEWRGSAGAYIPLAEDAVMAWRRNCDGDPIGDPVLFVRARRVGPLAEPSEIVFDPAGLDKR